MANSHAVHKQYRSVRTFKKYSYLQESFHSAMETSQRVVKEIVDRDNQQISTLLDGMERLAEILNNSYSVMQDFSNFAAEYKAPNIVTENIIHVRILEANFSNILRDAANRLKSRAVRDILCPQHWLFIDSCYSKLYTKSCFVISFT